MKKVRTYKYKLYHDIGKGTKNLNNLINISGIIYNHCIALHKRYYRLYGKSLNKFQLQKHLTKLKKLPKYSYWKVLVSIIYSFSAKMYGLRRSKRNTEKIIQCVKDSNND